MGCMTSKTAINVPPPPIVYPHANNIIEVRDIFATDKRFYFQNHFWRWRIEREKYTFWFYETYSRYNGDVELQTIIVIDHDIVMRGIVTYKNGASRIDVNTFQCLSHNNEHFIEVISTQRKTTDFIKCYFTNYTFPCSFYTLAKVTLQINPQNITTYLGITDFKCHLWNGRDQNKNLYVCDKLATNIIWNVNWISCVMSFVRKFNKLKITYSHPFESKNIITRPFDMTLWNECLDYLDEENALVYCEEFVVLKQHLINIRNQVDKYQYIAGEGGEIIEGNNQQ